MPVYIPAGTGNVITGNLTVTGSSQINGNETVDKNVLIQGNETIEGNLTVLGTINGGGGGSGTFSTLTVTGDVLLNTGGGGAGTVIYGLLSPLGETTWSDMTIDQSGNIEIASGNNFSVYNNGESSLLFNVAEPTGVVSIGNSAITGSAGATSIQMPATSGTLLVGGGGTVVTTTTLDNDTLAASVTSLTTSLGVIASGQIIAQGTIISVPSTEAVVLGNYFSIPTIMGFQSSSIGALRLISTSLTTADSLTDTLSQTLDDGSGNMIVHGTLTVGTNAILTSGGAATLTLPTGTGTLALVPASSTLVTTTTLDNDTLQASVTTLSSSGTTVLGSSSGTVTTKNNTLDDGTGQMALTLTQTGSSLTDFTMYKPNILPGNFVQFSFGQSVNPNDSGQFQYYYQGSGSTNNQLAIKLASGSNALTITGNGVIETNSNVLDNGTGAATFASTVTVGGNAVLTSGGAATLTLPSTTGTLALAPNYFSGYSNTITSGAPVTWTAVSSRNISAPSSATFTLPSGNYKWSYSALQTSPVAATTYQVQVSGTSIVDSGAQGTGPTAGFMSIAGQGIGVSNTGFTFSTTGFVTSGFTMVVEIVQLL